MAKDTKNTPAAAHAKHAPEADYDEEAALASARAEFDADGSYEKVASGGFPPYIKPTVGAIYEMTPLWQDASNPEFVRNVCRWEADKPLMAMTGPVASPEPVEVRKGDLFSISDYAGLEFLDLMGLRVKVLVDGMRPLPPGRDGKHRNPMFVFVPKLKAEDKKTFEDRKASRLVNIQAQKNALAARDAEARVNALPVTPSSAVTPSQQQLRS
jgi:hypothetical protein